MQYDEEFVDLKAEKLSEIGKELDEMVSTLNISMIDACVLYCDKYNIEVELVGELLKGHQRIVSKIEKEAIDLNCISKNTSFELIFDE